MHARNEKGERRLLFALRFGSTESKHRYLLAVLEVHNIAIHVVFKLGSTAVRGEKALRNFLKFRKASNLIP